MTPEEQVREIAAGLSEAQRALILSLSLVPSRIGTRATWSERKAIADSLPNGLILRTMAADSHRYSLSLLGLAVRQILQEQPK